MTDASPPGDVFICTFGPYTFRCCVTAACTRCGAAPLDEDTGIAPHFDSPQQAAVELTRDWGWRLTGRSSRAEDCELLCPVCAAAAGDGGNPRPPAPDAGARSAPRTMTWWEGLVGWVEPAGGEHRANARVFPPARRKREEG